MQFAYTTLGMMVMETALCILFILSILFCIFVLIVDLNISRPCSKCHKHIMIKEEIDGLYFYVCEGCGHIQKIKMFYLKTLLKNFIERLSHGKIK